MFIKKGLVIIFLIALFSVFVRANAITQRPFSGVTVGGGLGPYFVLGKANLDSFVTNTPVLSNPMTATRNVSPDLGRIGFMGNIHLGYGHSFRNNFYLGFETFGERHSNYAGVSESRQIIVTAGGTTGVTVTSEEYQSKVPYDYGVTIRPGWQPSSHSLMYLSLGFAVGKLKNSHKVDFFGSSSIIPLVVNREDWHVGFRASVGTSILLADHLAFRLEYFCTYYGRLSLLPISFTLSQPSSPTVTIHNTTRMSKHGIGLNLDYLF